MPINAPVKESMTLASAILAGTLPASSAIGHPEIYDDLNRGANGKLPFLGSSAKIDAGMSVGILSTVLYMMPAKSSGREACAGRSDGCTLACLAEGTGRMSMSGPRMARIRRHASFYADRSRFLADISDELTKHARKATRMGKTSAARLNGTTDLPWHRMPFTDNAGVKHASLYAAHPSIRFYEYTKNPLKIAAKGGIPANVHLVFSISERDDADDYATEYLRAGYGAAVVTFTERHVIPTTFKVNGMSYPTTDGDAHDARFLDPKGTVVILAAKGKAKTDRSGFVRSA
jgi:hypothetical protein